ncbi:MAG TPA: putative porin [Bacteroidia bacterium]
MKYLLILLLIPIAQLAIGQNSQTSVYDTAKRQEPLQTDPESLHRGFRFDVLPDSSMVDLQQYDRSRRDNIGIQNLGDIGTPYLLQVFSPFTKTGFNTGINPFPGLYFNHSNASHYNSKMPYSRFGYSQGRGGTGLRGLINFEALHTQNIGEQINFALRYHSTSYDGFYPRQTISNKFIQFTSYYRSKNKRYLASAYLNWNKCNQLENGGIEPSEKNDSLFRSLGPTVRQVDMNLSTAKNINRLREHTIRQTYWLLMGKDSLPRLGISHHIKFSKESNYYTDKSADLAYYDSVYRFNSNYSSDSTVVNTTSNIVELFTPTGFKGIDFKAGIQYDHFKYTQMADAGNYHSLINHNLSIHSAFNFNLAGRFESKASGQLYLDGYNAGDYLLEWTNNTQLKGKSGLNFHADAKASSRQPFYRNQKMFSNHYNWDNNFEKTNVLAITAGISKSMKRKGPYNAFYYTLPQKALGIDVTYFLIDRMVYYDQNALPSQGAAGQNCIQANLYFHLNLKKFQLDQKLSLQQFSNNLKNTMLLPELISKSSLYFQTYAFKKTTFLQFGADCNISSSYTANYYNPGTSAFQLSSKTVGAYPFLDLFINAEVKTARIFLKMEHVNQDLMGTYYYKNYLYTSPYYPSAPRRFRLGFIWKFYY